MEGGVSRLRHDDVRDTCVERHEPRTMENRQRKQVYVGQLPGPLDVLVRDKLLVEQRDVVGQELMTGCGNGLRQCS